MLASASRAITGSRPTRLRGWPAIPSFARRWSVRSPRPTSISAPERIKRFTIVASAWLPGGDELTPTMKPRRKVILAKYATEIEALYA